VTVASAELNFLSGPGGAEEDVYDVIVIGGGPAGTTAAIYTARAALSTLVVDKGMMSGAMGSAARIANYPGVAGEVRGADLLEQMRHQAERMGARFVKEKVLGTGLVGEEKQVWTSQGMHRGRAVIIATGAMGRTRTIPGEEQLVGRGVSYCATCDGAFFQDRMAAVVGNSTEALEEALFLARFASQVYLLSPTPDLKASIDLIRQVDGHPKIEIYPTARLREIMGQERVQAVRFSSLDEERTLPLDGVFIYLQGRGPITDFLGDQLEVDESGCLLVGEVMQTAIPGVFAAGDVLCKHVKQAVVAAADGATAAMAARRYLSGSEKLRPDWL
jgi:thioredoxin reductase (NADPH)